MMILESGCCGLVKVEILHILLYFPAVAMNTNSLQYNHDVLILENLDKLLLALLTLKFNGI